MTTIPFGDSILVSEGAEMRRAELPITFIISGIVVQTKATFTFDPPVRFQVPTVVAGTFIINTLPVSWWRRMMSWGRRPRVRFM